MASKRQLARAYTRLWKKVQHTFLMGEDGASNSELTNTLDTILYQEYAEALGARELKEIADE